MNDKVVFEVEFDSEVWKSLTTHNKNLWIDQVSEAINEHALVVGVFIREEQK